MRWGVLFSAGALVLGCNAVLGIEERHLPDASVGGAPEGGAPSGACLPKATQIRTGVIQVDGLLDAADAISQQYLDIEKDVHSRIEVTARTMGLDTTDGYSPQLVDELIAAMQQDVAANSAEGVAVFLEQIRCHADVAATLEQQNRCEDLAGCDTTTPSSEVECDGLCLGGCAGICDECSEDVTDATCSGDCLGDCALPSGGTCDGQCEGACSGVCVGTNQTLCDGGCDGTCTGSCQLLESSTCSGGCTGECRTESKAECPTAASCSGHCEGVCDGDCFGRAVPLPGDAACEWAEECALQASLVGASQGGCDVPTVEVAYDVGAGISSGDAAQFKGHMDAVVLATPQLLVDLAQLEMIAIGQVKDVQLSPTPAYALVRSALKDIASRAERGLPVSGVPEGCEAELTPFVAPTVETLDSLYDRGAALAGDQIKYLTALESGFD